METTVLLTACILIGLGVLMKRFPMLIAGYNTLTEEEKEKIDTKGLSSFMCYSFVGMGIAPLIVYYICLGLGHADWAGMSSLVPLLYLPYLIYRANKFDHNPPRRSRRPIIAIAVFTIFIVAVLMLNGMSPSKVRIEDGRLVFTGMFGTSRSVSDIKTIDLTNKLPDISLRLNGISVAGINKGRFKAADGRTCYMYLSSSNVTF